MQLQYTFLMLSAYTSLSLAAFVATGDDNHRTENISPAVRNVPFEENSQILTILLGATNNSTAINSAINQRNQNNNPSPTIFGEANSFKNQQDENIHTTKRNYKTGTSDFGPKVSEVPPSSGLASVIVASIVVGLCISYMVVFLTGAMLAEWKKRKGKAFDQPEDDQNNVKPQPVQVVQCCEHEYTQM